MPLDRSVLAVGAAGLLLASSACRLEDRFSPPDGYAPSDLADLSQSSSMDVGSGGDGDIALGAGDLARAMFTSCNGLAATCGPSGTSSCCDSSVVAGGTFYRSYDVLGDASSGNMSNPATISDLRLDRFEVTVGRFRAFVNSGPATQANTPAAGAGARTLNSIPNQGGWNPSWNMYLAADGSSLSTALNCGSAATWTPVAGSNENLPINCVTWYEADAFCAWDGGFLPTDAEWNYAASGGSEQRVYAWSAPPNSTTIDSTYAVYSTTAAQRVGSKSPNGDGKWGQSDLIGNVEELTLDYYPGYLNPCSDCADFNSSSTRAGHGSGFNTAPVGVNLRSIARFGIDPTQRFAALGFRCARAK